MEQLRDKVITVRLNEDEWQMLDDLSKLYKEKKSVVIRTLIINQWKKK